MIQNRILNGPTVEAGPGHNTRNNCVEELKLQCASFRSIQDHFFYCVLELVGKLARNWQVLTDIIMPERSTAKNVSLDFWNGLTKSHRQSNTESLSP